MSFLFVALGGALGAVARYAISLIPVKTGFPIIQFFFGRQVSAVVLQHFPLFLLRPLIYLKISNMLPVVYMLY